MPSSTRHLFRFKLEGFGVKLRFASLHRASRVQSSSPTFSQLREKYEVEVLFARGGISIPEATTAKLIIPRMVTTIEGAEERMDFNVEGSSDIGWYYCILVCQHICYIDLLI